MSSMRRNLKHAAISHHPPGFKVAGLSVVNCTPILSPADPLSVRRTAIVQPPTHSGPSTQSLVITVGIPQIIVRYPPGRVESFSRHQIARGLNCTPSMISQIFCGRRNVSIQMALKLRSFLGVTLDYLIDDLIPSTVIIVRDHVTEKQAEILNDRTDD